MVDVGDGDLEVARSQALGHEVARRQRDVGHLEARRGPVGDDLAAAA